MILRLLLLGVLLTGFAYTSHATDTEQWDDTGTNVEHIDHTHWQKILDSYIVEKKNNNAQPPINLFKYGSVSNDDKTVLAQYLKKLQSIDPRDYAKEEQFAYWVNLYNAATVDLILKNYPVKSITKLGGILSFGPWDKEILTVADEAITLNDIEHKILRPIWKDARIHYAVNCASYSCPNLSATAFTSKNADTLLEQAAKDYVNHPRAVHIKDDTLELSEIYKWYAEDFGESEQDVVAHISNYAEPDLAQKLKAFDGDIDYDYDWSLNEAK